MVKTAVVFIFTVIILYTAFGYSQPVSIKIDDYLLSYVQHNRLSGGVIILEKNDVIYKRAFGFADKENQILNTTQTPFMLASVSKPFTSLAILQLAEQGKISFNIPVTNYLPDYPSNSGKKITIHHLLTHTSGLPDLFASEDGLKDILPDSTIITLDALIDRFKDRELEFSPGNKQRYSNSNYFLLTKIIETVSGLSFDEYLTKNIFVPAGLEHSFYRDVLPEQGIALPYYGFDQNNIRVSNWSPSWAAGAGGIFSNLEDLGKFYQAIINKKLLNEHSTKIYFSRHIDEDKGNYGYGWEFSQLDGFNIIEHDGGTLGYSTYMLYNPSRNIFLTFYTNHTHNINNLDITVRQSKKIVYDLHKLLNGNDVEGLPKPVVIDQISNSNLRGTYLINKNTKIHLNVLKQNLQISISHSDSLSIFDLIYQEHQLNGFEEQFEIAKEVFSGIQKGNFSYLRSHSSFIIKVFLFFSSKIESAYQQITAGMGAMESFNVYKIERIDDKTIVANIWSRFESRNVIWKLFYDDSTVKGIKYYANYEKIPPLINAKLTENNVIFIDGYSFGIDDQKCTLIFNNDNNSIKGIQIGDKNNNLFAKKL